MEKRPDPNKYWLTPWKFDPISYYRDQDKYIDSLEARIQAMQEEKQHLKEKILDRLYETSSICSFCRKKLCGHQGNRELILNISVDDVLNAIDLDNIED